jgi:hypothetical protein
MLVGNSYHSAIRPSQTPCFGAKFSATPEAEALMKDRVDSYHKKRIGYYTKPDEQNKKEFNANEFYKEFGKKLEDVTMGIPGTIMLEAEKGNLFIKFNPNDEESNPFAGSGILEPVPQPVWTEGARKLCNRLFVDSILPIKGDPDEPQIHSIVRILADLENYNSKRSDFNRLHDMLETNDLIQLDPTRKDSANLFEL